MNFKQISTSTVSRVCHSCAISFLSHARLILRLKSPGPEENCGVGAARARAVRVCNCRFMGSQAAKSAHVELNAPAG